jgi:antitoxin component of MazEF toxin-antitoxin module
MSKALSKHSSLRQSGNSIVVTVPAEIKKELSLDDGDSVFWSDLVWTSNEKRVTLNFVDLEKRVPPGLLKKGDGAEDAEDAATESDATEEVAEIEEDEVATEVMAKTEKIEDSA